MMIDEALKARLITLPSIVHLANIRTGSGWKQLCLLRLVMIMRPVLPPLSTGKGVLIRLRKQESQRKGQVIAMVCPISKTLLLA